MGGDQSKPQERNQNPNVNCEDANHFFVQEIKKVSFRNRRQVSYYWIDPKVYNAQNQKYYNQFLAHFKIDSFTSLEALRSQLDEIQNNELIKVITAASLPDDDYRYMQNDPKIAQLFLFCGNEERAKLLCKNFPKICSYALKAPQMVEVLKKFQQEDKLDLPLCSLLCMLEEDRKLLNRYRLNYFCITSPHNKQLGKEDFIKVAQQLMPEQQSNIAKFQAEYNTTLKGKPMYEQALQWAFSDSFYWSIIERLPKATTNPKRLAYLRLPFSDLYQAIFETKSQKEPQELYIVVNLNTEEVQQIKREESLSNFIIFTSFIKGFTKKADAIKEFKQSQKSYLFEVTFQNRHKEPKLDFGFVISQDKTVKKNVIFNIYNFFQLDTFIPQKRTGNVVYGPLAQAYYHRADQTSRKRLQENQAMLLRNYDYIEQLIRRDSSQAVILQMYGYFKESLQVYDKKVQFLRENNASQAELAKYTILRGDAYRMTQDYEQAEKQYKSITNEEYKSVALVHLFELYLKKGDDKQAQQVQQQLQPTHILKKLKEKYPQEGFKVQNYIAMQWMKQNRYKQALKKYRNLQNEATVYYQYRFEGIPIVHDIFRNMATCQARLNNHKQALNLLQSTKNWQLVCQGESAGLALTQTMIQCVHEDMGEREKAEKAGADYHYLAQGINLQEKRYLNQSNIAISMGLNPIKNVVQSRVNVNPNNINTSSVNVNVNSPMYPPKISQSSLNVNQSSVSVNQSSVNVNMNNPQNINQSSVLVNMNQPQPNINIQQSAVNVQVGPHQQNWMVNKSRAPSNINQSNISINL